MPVSYKFSIYILDHHGTYKLMSMEKEVMYVVGEHSCKHELKKKSVS